VLVLNISAGSKIFKFKPWFTLPEVAKHLSGVFGEEVTEANILRFALDGHLKLSVLFTNNTCAKLGRLITIDSVEKLLKEAKVMPTLVPIYNEDGDHVYFENKIEVINDVWDLTMFGNERQSLEVEWEHLTRFPTEIYQPFRHETKGHETYLGAVVSKSDVFAQLQVSKASSIDFEEQSKFVDGYRSRAEHENFCPSLNLPSSSILVVRKEALREFEQLIDDNDTEKTTATKPHGNAERHAANREQVLGAAFAVLAKWPEECKDAKGDPKASKIAALVDAKADLFWIDAQVPLATDSIADHLRDWIRKTNSNRK
jgi:hypothetical protein